MPDKIEPTPRERHEAALAAGARIDVNAEGKIQPALSAEEWSDRGHPVVSGYIDWDHAVVDVTSGGGWGGEEERFIPGLIALANAALPDSDLRKITREMLSFVRFAGIALEGAALLASNSERTSDIRRTQAALSELADALESYLPPAT